MINCYYSADGGSIAIYSGGSIFTYHNGFGDGDFNFYVLETKADTAEIKNFNDYRKYHFISTMMLKDARVLDYDCYKLSDIDSLQSLQEKTIVILNGTYAIYNDDFGNIYFEKWN